MSKEQTYPLANIAPAGSNMFAHAPYIFLPAVLQALLSSQSDDILHTIRIDGMLTKPLKELQEYFRAKGGRLVIESEIEHVYLWKDSYVDVHTSKKDNTITISGYLLDSRLHGIVQDLERDFISKNKKNLVFTIIRNPNNSLAIRN